MSAAVKLQGDVSAAELRAMARESRDSRQCRRLLALAAVAEGRSRSEAAALGGMDRQTLPDWVRRFNAEGAAGLGSQRSFVLTAGIRCRGRAYRECYALGGGEGWSRLIQAPYPPSIAFRWIANSGSPISRLQRSKRFTA